MSSARVHPERLSEHVGVVGAFVAETASKGSIEDLARRDRRYRWNGFGGFDRAFEAGVECCARYVETTGRPLPALEMSAERVATGRYYGNEWAYALLAALEATD